MPEIDQPKWLPEDEPATERQRERLKALASAEVLAEDGEKVGAYVQGRIADGLSQQEAWELIGRIGARIAEVRRNREPEERRPSL